MYLTSQATFSPFCKAKRPEKQKSYDIFLIEAVNGKPYAEWDSIAVFFLNTSFSLCVPNFSSHSSSPTPPFTTGDS